jgi:hypothetical protein
MRRHWQVAIAVLACCAGRTLACTCDPEAKRCPAGCLDCVMEPAVCDCDTGCTKGGCNDGYVVSAVCVPPNLAG